VWQPFLVRNALAAALLVGAVFACARAEPAPAERARAIESQVWSPYCPGRLLSDCTTQQARELRAEILRRVEGGQSGEEVLAWIRRNHGDEALARPEASGAGLLLWLAPAAIFAAGAAVLVVLVRRWSRAPA
jgi:cytochrome c-type biogenesis protein CcmH